MILRSFQTLIYKYIHQNYIRRFIGGPFGSYTSTDFYRAEIPLLILNGNQSVKYKSESGHCLAKKRLNLGYFCYSALEVTKRLGMRFPMLS